MLRGLDEQMERRSDRVLYYMDRIWVPLMGDVRTLIMDEAHKSRYSVHSGADKMYYDLRDMYWWPGMKKDTTLYVSKCLTCLKVKAKHQKPSSLLRSGNDSIWVIMDRLTKSTHFLPIREDFKMDRLARLYLNEIVARHDRWSKRAYHSNLGRHAQSMRHRLWRKLGCSSSIGVVRFLKKGKLAPRFVGPFEITERIGLVAYRLSLPLELSSVHDTFHVLNLKKCLADPTLYAPLEEIQVDAKLNFVEELIEILEHEIKKLKRSRIPIVKV
ncbi:putative reverse transcriptase domain-containing protein [Tanacetum coccineum]